jgi:Spectrin repeat
MSTEVFTNVQEGQDLMSHKHYASKDISDQLERLEAAWKTLLAATQEKKERLQEAYQASIESIHCLVAAALQINGKLYDLLSDCKPVSSDSSTHEVKSATASVSSSFLMNCVVCLPRIVIGFQEFVSFQ